MSDQSTLDAVYSAAHDCCVRLEVLYRLKPQRSSQDFEGAEAMLDSFNAGEKLKAAIEADENILSGLREYHGSKPISFRGHRRHAYVVLLLDLSRCWPPGDRFVAFDAWDLSSLWAEVQAELLGMAGETEESNTGPGSRVLSPEKRAAILKDYIPHEFGYNRVARKHKTSKRTVQRIEEEGK